MESMASDPQNTSTGTSPDSSSKPESPVTDEMVSTLAKTFMVAHVDDSDEHLAQALVYNAARMAWRMREIGLTTEMKTSVSDVVTAADRAAEKFISEVLRGIRPEDGLLGEEGASAESESGRTWVIDPVDGTYNFTTGSDYWCSALALVEGDPDDPDTVIFGAVHRPAMGYTWFGGPDIPTTRDGDAVGDLEDVTPDSTCLGGYLHPTDIAKPERQAAWASVATQFATVRMLGSASIDLAGVATGNLGCWMQRSVASWDWLPGRALVEGAGGTTARVQAAGVEWFIAGADSSVQEAARALREQGE